MVENLNQHSIVRSVSDLCYFADEIKNIKPKQELEEEEHNKMVTDSNSPNEESETENGKPTVQRHYGQFLALPCIGVWTQM